MAAGDGAGLDTHRRLRANLAIYGLNRMFQGLGGRDAEAYVSVFTARAAATAWLLED